MLGVLWVPSFLQILPTVGLGLVALLPEDPDGWSTARPGRGGKGNRQPVAASPHLRSVVDTFGAVGAWTKSILQLRSSSVPIG